MIKRIQALRASDSGFTLIELLIVIVVLGILAGIVVFGVSTFRADAQLAACKADLKTVSVAEDAFNAKNGVGAPLGAVGTPLTLLGDGYLKAAPAAASQITITLAGTPSVGTVASGVAGCV